VAQRSLRGWIVEMVLSIIGFAAEEAARPAERSGEQR
jgi:hypothetical protein